MESSILPYWVADQADRRPAAPAVDSPSARLTYAVLAERVRALAGILAAAGVGPGARVLVALPNTPATVVAGLAVQAAGAVPVEVNRAWGPDVLGEVIAHSRVHQAIVWGADARCWGTVVAKRTLERLWVVHPAPLSSSLLAALGPIPAVWIRENGTTDPSLGPAPAPPLCNLRPEDPAVVLYTSGSTGRPRGVIQTFGNIAANTRSIVQYLCLCPDDRALVVLPLYYCYGRSVLQTHLFTGGSVFLEPRTAFPAVVMESLGVEACTGMAGVPLTFEILRRQVNVSELRFPRLRYLTQAGGAMASDTITWVRESFRPAQLFVMYGQTEATARLSYLPPERAEEKEGSIGVPIPGVELAVVDEDARRLPAGETGHLVARGENVTPGYLDEPQETAAILRDGWLWTGDLAFADADGYFFLQGRSKEILKIGGHRVGPAEIENVLAGHPDVAEAAVVGIADALMGEVPVAFVVVRGGRAPAEEELRRFCHERMAAFKVPVRVQNVKVLPRNEAGKLLRAELVSRIATPGRDG